MAARNSAVVMRRYRDEFICEFGPVEDAQELVMDAPLIELRVPPPDSAPRELPHIIRELQRDLDAS